MEQIEAPATESGNASENTEAHLPVVNQPGKASGLACFARENPGLVIAGGVALGLLAGALIPKRNRQRIASGASHLAELASAAGLALARQAQERAESAGEELRRHGSGLTGTLDRIASSAGERIHDIADGASNAATRAGQQITKATSEVRARIGR